MKLKRTLLLLAVCPAFCSDLDAQINSNTSWIWMHGDDAAGQNGVYGTPGVPAATNKPGGRTMPVSWTTRDGYMWMFGGYGNSSSAYGRLNDLWRYVLSSNEWTWMKGDDDIELKAVYGTQGVAAANNKPGARSFSASWSDTSGNLWLFGGFGFAGNSSLNNDYLNDLWKYNTKTNEWVWVKGDTVVNKTGVYGTKGV